MLCPTKNSSDDGLIKSDFDVLVIVETHQCCAQQKTVVMMV